MDEILTRETGQMTGLTFDCSCGRKHAVGIKNIVLGPGVSKKMPGFARKYQGKSAFLVADAHTYRACGKTVETVLSENGVRVTAYVFPGEGRLIPDEKALGRLLVEIPPHTDLIVAVGSGTINDMSRMLSSKTRIPYWIVCTAPSMDGYASTVSPLIIEGFKTTYDAVYPEAILADSDVVHQAPMEMIQAGFGDIIGKYTALTDWVLSRELNGEYYCETSVRLMEGAVRKCVDNIDAVIKRDGQAVLYILDALLRAGIAMGMVGNSRPASGAEHHMAHYWEMDAIRRGAEHPLHGNSVGVAAVVSASLYELMKDRIPPACHPPAPEKIRALLRKAGSCDNPKDLGISRGLFRESVLHAKEVRPRYTILRFASEQGLLEGFADTLTRRFYGE